MRIGFLFNHDALHQVRHSAPVAAALIRMGVSVTILTSSPEQAGQVRLVLGEAAQNARFVSLDPGPVAAAADRVLRFVVPFRRLAVLRRNRAAFADLDVLVVPETTSLLLRDRFGLSGLRFVWIPHGAGDRSVGFRPVVRGFDLVLLAGAKVRDRMLAMKLVTPETSRIVGYPKFDTVDPARPLASPFANGRPTVIYNPHFDPRLSSWYDWGPDILRWFARQERYNLIFAPHAMLWSRRLHASVEHRRVRWRPAVPQDVRDCPHILIDTDSARLSDMSYTRAADLYLGDASSQIYEWIARPRPAVFLNPGRHAWRHDPDFAHWHLGDVLDDIEGLGAALTTAFEQPQRFGGQQRDAFAHTFSVTHEAASVRAARAIVERFGSAGVQVPPLGDNP